MVQCDPGSLSVVMVRQATSKAKRKGRKQTVGKLEKGIIDKRRMGEGRRMGVDVMDKHRMVQKIRLKVNCNITCL